RNESRSPPPGAPGKDQRSLPSTIAYKWCWFREWSTYLAGYEFDSYTYDGKTFKLIVDIRSARKSIRVAD
ncbi:MAG: hypothetical protein ACKPKO_53650, partial [Candidatus Fonsibacter sp.]